MAYEFKKLSEVDVVESPSDVAHVLIEENGIVKKVVKNAVGETSEVILGKLAAVDSTETPAETANVLIEEDGVIKKVAKTAVGETAEAILGKIATVNAAEEPADDANILIEEDGVVKRIPASSISGEKADLVLALTAPAGNVASPTSENTSVAIESGSLEAIAEAMRAGRPPIVKCKRFWINNGFNTSYPIVEGGVYDCDVLYYNGYIHMQFAIPRNYMAKIIMNIDDPDYLEVWFYPLAMTTFQVI